MTARSRGNEPGSVDHPRSPEGPLRTPPRDLLPKSLPHPIPARTPPKNNDTCRSKYQFPENSAPAFINSRLTGAQHDIFPPQGPGNRDPAPGTGIAGRSRRTAAGRGPSPAGLRDVTRVSGCQAPLPPGHLVSGCPVPVPTRSRGWRPGLPRSVRPCPRGPAVFAQQRPGVRDGTPVTELVGVADRADRLDPPTEDVEGPDVDDFAGAVPEDRAGPAVDLACLDHAPRSPSPLHAEVALRDLGRNSPAICDMASGSQTTGLRTCGAGGVRRGTPGSRRMREEDGARARRMSRCGGIHCGAAAAGITAP